MNHRMREITELANYKDSDCCLNVRIFSATSGNGKYFTLRQAQGDTLTVSCKIIAGWGVYRTYLKIVISE